jgi:hypothetical protein
MSFDGYNLVGAVAGIPFSIQANSVLVTNAERVFSFTGTVNDHSLFFQEDDFTPNTCKSRMPSSGKVLKIIVDIHLTTMTSQSKISVVKNGVEQAQCQCIIPPSGIGTFESPDGEEVSFVEGDIIEIRTTKGTSTQFAQENTLIIVTGFENP